MSDEIISGIDNICKLLGWSRQKFDSRKPELIEAGVLFYQRTGRPPRKRGCVFLSSLKNWIAFHSSRGDIL
jgi:hypothetical protein